MPTESQGFRKLWLDSTPNRKGVRIHKGHQNSSVGRPASRPSLVLRRPTQSTGTNLEQPSYSRSTTLLPRSTVRSTSLVHRSSVRSSGPYPGLLHTPFLLSLTSGFCAIFLYPLSPLSLQYLFAVFWKTNIGTVIKRTKFTLSYTQI